MVRVAYTAGYSGDDIAGVVIDIIVKAMIAIGAFATLVGLAVVYRFFKGEKLLPSKFL